MAIHYDDITIYGITYKANGAIKIPSSFTGKSSSDGGNPSYSGSAGTYYYKCYATGDGVTYPYAISESSSGSILCWIKAAVFPKATYSVKYSANGGSGAPSTQTKTYGTTLTLSSTKPTHSSSSSTITTTYNYNYSGSTNGTKSSTKTISYSFSKWNTSSGGGGTSYSPGGSYTANAAATLYAQWTSSTSYSSFTLPTPSRSNSTSTITTTYNYNYSGSTSGSKSSTKTISYTFSKWNTKSDGSGTSYSGGGTYKPTSNSTLYAQWSSSTSYSSFTLPSPTRSNATTNYTVTYNANGGTCGKSSATATKTTKYTFSKWNTKSDGSGTSYSGGGTYKPTSNTTLYAQWTSSTTNGTVTLPTPTRTGYTFKGWATSSSATSGTAAGATYTVSSNTTLYATWAVNTGTLHYHPNGGNANDGYPLATSGTYTGFSTTTTTYNYNSTDANLYNVSTLFNRAGYHIVSSTAWRVNSATSTTYFNQDSQNLRSYATTNGTNVKLYANWIANTYSIKYNANATGATGTMSNSSHTYDVSKALTANAFALHGYAFQGWATSETGSVKYNNNANVVNLTTTNGGTVNLYAVWIQTIFTVRFDVQGGISRDVESIALTIDDVLPDITPPLRNGYTFGGYFTSTNGSGIQYYDTDGTCLISTVDQNVTLYAYWEPLTYDVTLVDNATTIQVQSGQDMPTLASLPVKTGYIFQGYFTEQHGEGIQYYRNDGTSAHVFEEYADISLYADWKPIQYTIVFDNSTSDRGSMEPVQCTYDVSVEMPPVGLYRNNYFLKCWLVQGTAQRIQKTATVMNLSAIDGANVVLQPVWQYAHIAYYPVQTGVDTYEWKLCYLYYGTETGWQPCVGKIGRVDHWVDTEI